MSVMDIKQSNFLRFLSGLHLNMTLMLNPSLISCFPVLKLLPQLVKLLAASGGVFPFYILSLAIFVWKEQFSYTGSRKGKKIKIKEQIIFYFCYLGNLMGLTKTEKKLKISFITYIYFINLGSITQPLDNFHIDWIIPHNCSVLHCVLIVYYIVYYIAYFILYCTVYYNVF